MSEQPNQCAHKVIEFAHELFNAICEVDNKTEEKWDDLCPEEKSQGYRLGEIMIKKGWTKL